MLFRNLFKLPTLILYTNRYTQSPSVIPQDGHLKWTKNPVRGKPLLPTDPENHECKAPSGRCFTGGRRSLSFFKVSDDLDTLLR